MRLLASYPVHSTWLLCPIIFQLLPSVSTCHLWKHFTCSTQTKSTSTAQEIQTGPTNKLHRPKELQKMAAEI